MESRWTDTKVLNNGAETGDTTSWTVSGTTVEDGGVSGSKVFKIAATGSMSQTLSAFRFQPAQIKLAMYYYSAADETEEVTALVRYTITYASGAKSYLVVPLRAAYNSTYPGLADGSPVNYLYFEDLVAILDSEVLSEITIDIETSAHGAAIYIDDIDVFFDLGVTEVYGRESETPTINDKGINSNFLKNFKNMLHNSQFEAYDPTTDQPFFWECSNVTVKTTANSNFFGTRSVQVPIGQWLLYDGTGRVNPTWYNSQITRVSFYCRNGTIKVEVYDYTVPASPVAFTLTNEDGTEASYHEYTFASWHGGVGNSASRAVVSFDPGSSTDVRIKFTNTHVGETAYIDAVVLEPDFTNQWPSIYTDGPFSVFPSSVGIYVQDTEPSGVAVQQGTLWLDTNYNQWKRWDSIEGWVETVGGGGVLADGLYAGVPLELLMTIVPDEVIDITPVTSNYIDEIASGTLITLSGLTCLLLHGNGSHYDIEIVDSSLYPKIPYNYQAYLFNSNAKYGDGSIFLDGTAYMTVPDHADFNFGAGDFTIEVWIDFWGSLGTYTPFYNQYTSTDQRCLYWGLYYSGGILYMTCSLSSSGTVGTAYTSAIPFLIPKVYYHFAVVRDGSNLHFFVDGIKYATHDIGSITLFDSNLDVSIGASDGLYTYSCCIDDYHVSKGIARYTTDFTPVEASADAYSVLLLEGDSSFGSTIVDTSGTSKTITSVDNAITNNTPQKFGTACIRFKGDAYLEVPGSPDLDFDDKDFTIHFWVRFDELPATSQYSTLICKCNTTSSHLQYLIQVYNNGGTYRLSIRWSYNGSTAQQQITDYAFTVNTLYHIAIVRNGTNLVSYINGTTLATTSVGTSSIYKVTTSSRAPYPLLIGAYYNSGFSYNYKFKGWLDEVVIKREAIWTTDFTPLTSESSP